ncbi:transcriptional regulator [Tersicoccus solisilvae]|uniref:Transcriptional regulator n=1 Tax=Tersicoccus solisilvae TaxID=1882339 RepID=A0ABQ1PHS2_9MICC|nr:LysR family transcriptional regulator [Tersicoccus solisilvae]GGC97374.1 transcriptional regulator [Tersicoccus solisilvae]
MEVRWLEAFVAVAEEMHFGRAATRLHMAQSPLSQVIRRLEREIGTPLFERSTRSVALTGSGEALLPYAYRTLRTLTNAVDAARSAEGVPTGRFTLGFSGVHNHHTLPRITQALRRDFPSIELRLAGGVRTFDGIRSVRNGDLDAAFIGLVGDVDAPLRAREISRQHIGCVVPADHALAGRGPVAVGRLRGEPFVMGPVDGNSSMTVVARQLCQAAGFTPEVAQTVSDPFLILSMVAAGVGITLVSSEVVPILPASAVWVELDGEPVIFRHGVLWSEENESIPLRAFLRVLDDVFPARPDPDSVPAS